jgi:GNAT superfamily N-acetyltransferase
MIHIRQATADDAEAIAHVIVDTWRTAYRGIVPDEVLTNLSHEEFARNYRQSFEEQETRTTFTLVAEDGQDQVVGVASTAPTLQSDAPYTVQIRVLYVLPTHQGLGVGWALVRAAAEQLAAQGHGAMVIWVLRANTPARRFYEALGGHLIGERRRELLGFVGEEVAYGWPELRAWLARPT